MHRQRDEREDGGEYGNQDRPQGKNAGIRRSDGMVESAGKNFDVCREVDFSLAKVAELQVRAAELDLRSSGRCVWIGKSAFRSVEEI